MAREEIFEPVVRYHRKYHYRVVFEEFATTVYEEKSCNNVSRAIADVVKDPAQGRLGSSQHKRWKSLLV
ncbi:hypothetical protein C8R42DRAFT_692178 [Lentinula raphanica]|nr:hypothetical protein C8R42DRAFT_692178 [Lentinula raphanica]